MLEKKRRKNSRNGQKPKFDKVGNIIGRFPETATGQRNEFIMVMSSSMATAEDASPFVVPDQVKILHMDIDFRAWLWVRSIFSFCRFAWQENVSALVSDISLQSLGSPRRMKRY
ncbi:hypothetical protein CDAR_51211 [Caerostris darwini]|uniref:Uncharacterized protein n=1 Tax=Caerostris darwini TaxID=1538125 RepID=A0AAV4U5S2_9ARAC|nr:hypothetical protein CDAR_51211 [Caerostris darwini]